ncbi:MAG: substrate-binding domain-containing protein [Armatimonadetes bacterium]|nr:substrate-binding domain-containing protein [Armatimonadota bacterium]
MGIWMFSDAIDKLNATPAYRQVKLHIRSLIEGGQLVPGDRLPPEPEFARALGVSRMTANRALNELAAEGFLERRKGYGTYVLGTVRSNADVAVLCHEDIIAASDNHYFGKLLLGIHSNLVHSGHKVRMERWEEEFPESALGAHAAVLICPRQAALTMWERRASIPTVVVGASWDTDTSAVVDTNNRSGIQIAFEHLRSLGHTRITFVGALPRDANTIDRIQAFRELRQHHHLEKAHPALVFEYAIHFSDEERQEVAAMLQSPDRPTAVIAAGAHVAMMVVREAARVGLSIPDDLSVVGFDDPPFLSLIDPPITTVKQPLEKMAKVTADLCQKLLSDPLAKPTITIIDPELVVRGSTAPAP